MSDLQIFQSQEFGAIRTLYEDGAVLFCARDVAMALGYKKPQNAIAAHCKVALKRGIGVHTGTRTDGTPAMQEVETTFIPESDLYRLIFSSKLPSAEKFTDWVTGEVLPSIRKTGTYSAQPAPLPHYKQLTMETNGRLTLFADDFRTFRKPELGTIRGIAANGDIWIIGLDIVRALGYSETTHSIIERLVPLECREKACLAGFRGPSHRWIVNEEGVRYLLGRACTKKRIPVYYWLKEEILPVLRESAAPALPAAQQAAQPDDKTAAWMLRLLQTAQARIDQLEAAWNDPAQVVARALEMANDQKTHNV